MFTNKRVGIDVESTQFAPKRVVVYGNIVINTQDIGATIREDHIDYLSGNYISTSTEGFVDSLAEPFDFHLTELSPAVTFANNEIDFPRIDADGETRSINHLDAGAYQLPRNPNSLSSSLPEDAEASHATRRNLVRYGMLLLAIVLVVVFRKRIMKWFLKITN
jgi:hypothetical protein